MLRIVVRAGMHLEMADVLLGHLRELTGHLSRQRPAAVDRSEEQRQAFAH